MNVAIEDTRVIIMFKLIDKFLNTCKISSFLGIPPLSDGRPAVS